LAKATAVCYPQKSESIMWDDYVSPKSIEEALQVLQSHAGEARIIAGGTDLIPELKDRVRKVRCLVDISQIEPLKNIELRGDLIRIGAGVTHAQVASSALVRERATLLSEAASAVGSPLIRNQGTIVGNVVNAQPAADTAVALFSLCAEVEILSARGVTLVPIEQTYEKPGVSKVNSTSEIVTALYIRSLHVDEGSAFVRLAQRKALALPMLNVAAVVTVQGGRFKDTRITIGPVAPLPFRSREAEALLNNGAAGSELVDKAAEAASSEAHPRDSAFRGSAEYRREMVKVFVRRALGIAIRRSQHE
jgi:CO/xanthine dehydrogenase FAD-binding subunit